MIKSIFRSNVATLIVACFILSWFAQANAAAPKLMNYQGRATDPSGNPVTDGNHTVRFDLFNSATMGSSLWNETASVTTSGGLFTHTLGSVTPILESQFRYYEGLWLQVTFDGQVQTPRTQFTSVGYAFHVQSVHNAEGGNIRDGIAIYDPYTDNEIAGLMADGAGSSNLWLKGGDADQSYHNVKLDAATNDLEFIDRSSGNDTTVYGMRTLKMPANGSVLFPDNAISKREILDESGIACAMRAGLEAFTSTSAADVVTVSLTIPAAGYIFVEAKFTSSAAGRGQSLAYVQIDETAGGNELNPYSSNFGQDTLFSVNAYALVPGYVSRVYYKTGAGTYTFRLEGGELSGNCTECIPTVWYPILVATYFPTAYGSVSGLVSGADAGQFEEAVPVQMNGETMYQVDLRELELRAAKAEAEAERARADAEKAKRELLEAQDEASQN